jgi:hypothetical protein
MRGRSGHGLERPMLFLPDGFAPLAFFLPFVASHSCHAL